LGNGRDGGSLGGQRGGDCGRDLHLEGRGGGGLSHLKREEKLWPGAGVGGGSRT